MQLKNIFIFLSQIISLFPSIHTTNILEIPLIFNPNETDNRYSIYLSGYSKPISISFYHVYSYLSGAFFKERYSSPTEYPRLLGRSRYSIDYSLYSDTVSFANSNISFTFYFLCKDENLPKTWEKTYENILSLCESEDEKVKPLANELHYQNIIPSPSYVLSFKENMLYFGGIPKSKHVQQLFEEKISLYDLDKYGLIMNFTSFQMGNIVHDYNQSNYKFYISIKTDKVSLPYKLFNEIAKMYFMDYQYEGKCVINYRYVNEGKRERGFKCSKEVVNEFPDVVLGIGNHKLIIKKKFLFKCENNDPVFQTGCTFLFFRVLDDVFALGTSFLENYFVEVNLEENNNSFRFYSEVSNDDNDNFDIKKIVIGVNIGFIIFGCIYLFYIICRNE